MHPFGIRMSCDALGRLAVGEGIRYHLLQTVVQLEGWECRDSLVVARFNGWTKLKLFGDLEK